MQSKKITIRELSIYCLISVSIIFSLLFYLMGQSENNVNFILLAVVFIYAACIFYSFVMLPERMGFLIYSTMIFIFLVSRSFVRYLMGVPLEEYFPDEYVFKCLNLCFISYWGLLIGFALFKKKLKGITLGKVSKNSVRYFKATKILFYCILPFALFKLAMIALFVIQNGYTDYYLNFNAEFNNVPFVIRKVADCFESVFLILLAFLPDKKEIKKETALFAIYAVLTLLTGQRNGFILPIIFLIWYFSYRDYLSGGREKFIKKGFVPRMACVGVVFIMLFTFIANTRSSTNANEYRITDFFETQGASNHVLLRTFSIENQIPEELKQKFLFYPIINLVRSNVLTQAIFNTPVYHSQSVDTALNSYNYGSYHTYMYSPNTYLNGGGYGSSYIAEAYLAFGAFGVFLISALFGLILSFVLKIKTGNWVLRGIVFISLYWMFFNPRDIGLNFLVQGFNATNLCLFALIFVLGKLIKSEPKKIEGEES